MQIPDATQAHYRTMQAIQAAVVLTGRRVWKQVDPANPEASANRVSSLLLPVVSAAQERAALEGSAYAAMTLAQLNSYTQPEAFVDTSAFAGYASDGRSMDSLLYQPARGAQVLIDGGAPKSQAMAAGLGALEQILSTQIADTARQASGIDIASRTGIGYVRMLNPPSCSRCTVQAGKWFRWNTGFLRHPRCDCVHIANRAGSTQGALDEGLIDDPYKAFNGLPSADQDRIFGKANADAIRDGSDIRQVVNARSGMSANGLFTTTGTKSGNATRGLRARQRRMTPELIYKQANTREEALALLKQHGYILPGGQIPTGALRGQREGFGQLGGGGKRRGAVDDIEKARSTGTRDPRNRNTMTAAERRLYDAERDYKTALTGVSPYTSPGFGNKPDPYGLKPNRVLRPVTQKEMATAELQYRRMLATRGQKFIR